MCCWAWHIVMTKSNCWWVFVSDITSSISYNVELLLHIIMLWVWYVREMNVIELPWMTDSLLSTVCSYQPGFYQHQVTIPPSEPVPNVPDNHQAVNAPRAEAAANERPRPEIVRMNAQGGPLANDDEDEDEMRNRDWLDWVYVFVRFLLLLCILYFYSSFDRFLATTVLIVVIYLSVFSAPRP